MTENTLFIGVCDDEENDLKRIGEVLQAELQKLDVSITARLHLFSSGEELYRAIRKEDFDLLFLDIEMPGTDGFLLAKQIHMANCKTDVIFVSTHESLVFESQEYSPVWFVRKKNLERDCFLALRKYLQTFLPEERLHTIGRYTCPIRDILYIESSGHLLTIRKTNGQIFEQYGSLKAMEASLSEHGFLRTHKSYLVNLQYIEEIGRRDIRLTDGTVLEMGRDRRKAILETMRQYKEKHNGHQ